MPDLPPPRQERWLAYGLLLFALAFNLHLLSPEVTLPAPPPNDGIDPWCWTSRLIWSIVVFTNSYHLLTNL